MTKTVKHSHLESPKTRLRLKAGRQPHFQSLTPGNHLGYIRAEGKPEGRWILRRYKGGGNSYAVTPLGAADDIREANGTTILDHAQAKAMALTMVETPDGGKVQRMTVRQAMARYVEHKRALGQSVTDVMSRGTAHILPPLGDSVISELTSKRLQGWLAAMAASRAQSRPKKGSKPVYRSEPEGDEAIRKRRATANRVLNMLKAILNHAFDEGHVAVRDAWGRKLKSFRGVDSARARYLSIAEAGRLINASAPAFRPLVRAALETGARYSELGRLEVSDFNADGGTVVIRKSKTSKARHVILTEDGTAFFKAHCAGRAGHELLFMRDGKRWKPSEQAKPTREACTRAMISPPINFHGLRHTWASHAVMNGVPLMVVAKNLGHADTHMVEKFYGHLAPSFVADAIRARAPKYGIAPDKKVVPLK
jgi:integrase